MRYFGSKHSTLPELSEIVRARIPEGSFCDPFGGIGTVGAHFKSLGYKVCTGDVLTFAHYFQISRIHRQRLPNFMRLRTRLSLRSSNEIIAAMMDGHKQNNWFVECYALERRFFTIPNAQSIECAWLNILNWWNEGLLTQEEYAVLISSLINAMDQVANTAGTYYSYLKNWHRKALRPFKFQLLLPSPGQYSGICKLDFAHNFVNQSHYDILYLDPPYNERSYAHYYHLPETIAQGKQPEIHGISGIPINGLQRSVFNDPKKVSASLFTLLSIAKFRLLVFHYADDGLIPPEELRYILAQYGRVQDFVLQGRGYTTKNAPRRVSHRLYLVENA